MYKLGIIGFGVVGKSVLAFLNGKKNDILVADQQLFDDPYDGQCFDVTVWDNRSLSHDEQQLLQMYGGKVADTEQLCMRDFIKRNDFIIASPGVNLNDFHDLRDKFLCELDFFTTFFRKPSIAITGSLGKTTITKVIHHLASRLAHLPSNQLPKSSAQLGLSDHYNERKTLSVGIGGNVGIGMLDLAKHHDDYDLAVLELSSFQLEQNKGFSPDIAIWTNFYSNHLDRHVSLQDYFDAKFSMLRYQHERQAALLSRELFEGETGVLMQKRLPAIKSHLYICSAGDYDQDFIGSIQRERFSFFYADGNDLMLVHVHDKRAGQPVKLFDIRSFTDITFKQNWIQIFAALYLLGLDTAQLPALLKVMSAKDLGDYHHRVEHFATINGVDFYDDSKSTVIQATQTAIKKLAASGRPITLILGGLSKGADRSSLMGVLAQIPEVKKVYCFGKDCNAFQAGGCKIFQSLEDVMADIARTMQPGDQVLFSPSGASYDFFKNYIHRGQVFKKLVHDLAA